MYFCPKVHTLLDKSALFWNKIYKLLIEMYVSCGRIYMQFCKNNECVSPHTHTHRHTHVIFTCVSAMYIHLYTHIDIYIYTFVCGHREETLARAVRISTLCRGCKPVFAAWPGPRVSVMFLLRAETSETLEASKP